MSQVVYTELEGFPLRWEYKGAVPQETKKEADRTSKTWSVSTTPGAQVSNTTTGTANAVHGPNMVAQSFKSPNNATKVTSIQLYGNKVGSPPNPLYVEIRKVARKTKNTSNTESTDEIMLNKQFIYVSSSTTVTINTGTTGDKTLLQITDNLPAGNKIVLFALGWDSASAINAQGYLKIVSGGTTLVQEGITRVLNGGGMRSKPVMLFAYHANAPANAQYTFIATVTTAASGTPTLHVQGMVILLNGSAFFATGINTSIGGGATVTLATVNTNYPAGSKVAVLAYVQMGETSTLAGHRIYQPGNIRILRGSTIVSSNQFQVGTYLNTEPALVSLSYFDANSGANQAYSIQVYNSHSGTHRAWGEIIAFRVVDGAFLDTNSVALTNGSQVTVGNLSTSLGNEVGVIALAAAENTGTTAVTAFNAGDVVLQLNNQATGQVVSQRNWFLGQTSEHDRSGIYAFFRVDIGVSNPSYQVKMTARASGINGEAKILAFMMNIDETRFNVTFNRYIKEVRLKIRKVNSPGSLTAQIYADNVLFKTVVFSNITDTYDIYSINIEDVEYIGSCRITFSFTRSSLSDYYVFKAGTNQPSGLQITCDIGLLYYPLISYYDPEPSETVLASGSIGAASVGTTAAWINISISTIALRPSTYYTLVVYTIGGDASNYYAIHTGGTGGTPGGAAEIFMSSTNSGSTWTMNNNTDLSFQLMGVQYTEIYSGTISNNVKHPLGGVILQLSIKAQTLGGMEFTAFDDHTLTAPVVSSSAASQTEIIILKPTDPRIRDVVEAPQLSWSIWAAGSGLSTGAYTQRYVYMTKNPITPADFGFSELYLVMDELPPKALVALNDNVVAGLYNPSDTQTRIDSYELFRIPVRKAEVIAEPSSGKIVLYFIGVV